MSAFSIRPLSNRLVGALLVGGLALTGAGMARDLDWLVDIGAFSTAVVIGVGIGRLIAPRPGPLLAFLLLLSVVDVVWILFGGTPAAGWVDEVSNFALDVGTRTSSIGTVDLVLAAVVATHWLRRGAAIWLAIAAAPIGMALSNVYVAGTGVGNLALVPFITLGWLATEVWHRRAGRRQDGRLS